MRRAHRGDDDIAGEHRVRHAPAQRREAPGDRTRHSQPATSVTSMPASERLNQQVRAVEQRISPSEP